ncbi:Uncharacterised protein at_DN1912 [Pycnogonum litorale]
MVLFTGIGAVVGAISAAFYTVSGLFVKKMTGNVSVAFIFFTRMLTIAVISLLMLLVKRVKFWKHDFSDYVYMHLLAFTTILQIIPLFYSFQLLPIADVITIASSSPLFIFTARFLLYKRIPTILETTMMILTVVGVILCVQPSFIFTHLQHQDGQATRSLLNYLLPLLSALGHSMSYLCFERINEEVVVPTATFIFGLDSALISFLYVLVQQQFMNHLDFQNISYLLLACLTSFLASQTSFLAVKIENSLMASVGRAADILLGFIIDVCVFNLIPTVVTLLGATIILFGLLLPALSYSINVCRNN